MAEHPSSFMRRAPLILAFYVKRHSPIYHFIFSRTQFIFCCQRARHFLLGFLEKYWTHVSKRLANTAAICIAN
jgi:hypothetical protein